MAIRSEHALCLERECEKSKTDRAFVNKFANHFRHWRNSCQGTDNKAYTIDKGKMDQACSAFMWSMLNGSAMTEPFTSFGSGSVGFCVDKAKTRQPSARY